MTDEYVKITLFRINDQKSYVDFQLRIQSVQNTALAFLLILLLTRCAQLSSPDRCQDHSIQIDSDIYNFEPLLFSLEYITTFLASNGIRHSTLYSNGHTFTTSPLVMGIFLLMKDNEHLLYSRWLTEHIQSVHACCTSRRTACTDWICWTRRSD